MTEEFKTGDKVVCIQPISITGERFDLSDTKVYTIERGDLDLLWLVDGPGKFGYTVSRFRHDVESKLAFPHREVCFKCKEPPSKKNPLIDFMGNNTCLCCLDNMTKGNLVARQLLLSFMKEDGTYSVYWPGIDNVSARIKSFETWSKTFKVDQ